MRQAAEGQLGKQGDGWILEGKEWFLPGTLKDSGPLSGTCRGFLGLGPQDGLSDF